MKYYDVSDTFTSDPNPVADGLTLSLVEENSQSSDPLGDIKAICLHWTAGNYATCFNAYHFCTGYNPSVKEAFVVKCLKLTQKGQHLWHRNTGVIGVSLNAMGDSSHPVMLQQVKCAGALVGELLAWKQLDPFGKYMGPEGVEHPVLADHAYYAKIDGYADQRWDVGKYAPIIVAEAIRHYKRLKAHTEQFNFKSIIQ